MRLVTQELKGKHGDSYCYGDQHKLIIKSLKGKIQPEARRKVRERVRDKVEVSPFIFSESLNREMHRRRHIIQAKDKVRSARHRLASRKAELKERQLVTDYLK